MGNVASGTGAVKHSAEIMDFLVGTVLSNGLFVLSVITAIFEYVWGPIDCFGPSSFTAQEKQYAESYCQGQQSHWRDTASSGQSKWHRYEKWLPALLLFHAFLFRVPKMLWAKLSELSSVHLDNLLEVASKYQKLEADGREAVARTTSKVLYANYSLQDSDGGASKIAKYKRLIKRYIPFGILSLVSVLIALKYPLILTLAFDQLCKFLQLSSEDRHSYGMKWMNVSAGVELARNSVYTSDFMCDLDLVSGGTRQRYTLQCFLPLKRFYDFISVILWFCYNATYHIAWIAFVRKLIPAILPCPRRGFIEKCLKLKLALQNSRNQSKGDQNGNLTLQQFTSSHILTDGFFVLNTIAERIDDLFPYDVVNQLYDDVNHLNLIKNGVASDRPTAPGLEESRKPLLAPYHSKEISRM